MLNPNVEFLLPAFPGDVLNVHTEVARVGRTSLELRQRALRAADDAVLALTMALADADPNVRSAAKAALDAIER